MNLTFEHVFALIKLYLEKKRPQPKGRKITLVSGNKRSEVWAFLFQILLKWNERNIE